MMSLLTVVEAPTSVARSSPSAACRVPCPRSAPAPARCADTPSSCHACAASRESPQHTSGPWPEAPDRGADEAPAHVARAARAHSSIAATRQGGRAHARAQRVRTVVRRYVRAGSVRAHAHRLREYVGKTHLTYREEVCTTTHLLYPCDTSAASATLPTERASAGSVRARQAPCSAGEGNRGRQGEGGGGGKAAAFPTADERVGAEDPSKNGLHQRAKFRGAGGRAPPTSARSGSASCSASAPRPAGASASAYMLTPMYTSSGWRLLAALLYAAACST